jgi:hypothetical protein
MILSKTFSLKEEEVQYETKDMKSGKKACFNSKMKKPAKKEKMKVQGNWNGVLL